jgi:hypothetical protein
LGSGPVSRALEEHSYLVIGITFCTALYAITLIVAVPFRHSRADCFDAHADRPTEDVYKSSTRTMQSLSFQPCRSAKLGWYVARTADDGQDGLRSCFQHSPHRCEDKPLSRCIRDVLHNSCRPWQWVRRCPTSVWPYCTRFSLVST